MSDDDGVNVDTGLLDRPNKSVLVKGDHNLVAQAGPNASISIHKHFHITLTADIVPDIKSTISDEVRNHALRAIMSPPTEPAEATPQDVQNVLLSAASGGGTSPHHQDFQNTMSGLLCELTELQTKSNILMKRICNVFANYGAIPTDIQTGSVVFKLKIISRNRLRKFWNAYQDGTLQLELQDILITKDMETKAGCGLFVQLKIDDEDYHQGLEFFGKQELRLVLVGRTGTGKSTTGNHILLKDIKGQRPFATSVGGTGKTEECSYSSNDVLGRSVVVVDTPGLFDATRKNIDVLTQLTRFLLFTQPGPHAIIMVMRAGRMTPEFQQTAELLVKLFKEDVYGHMIVLFTGKDDLDEGEMLFEEYLETLPENIRKFVNKCGDRCLAFNNRATNDENLQQVNKLLDLIESIKENNGGHYFESDLQKELGFLLPNEKLTSDPETFRESVTKEEQVSGGWFWKALNAIATVLGWVV